MNYTKRDDAYNRISELQLELRSTDYVVIKMQEYQLQGKDITKLLSEYKDILARREAVRAEIRSLEGQLAE